jgi:hypothetical protein
MTTSRPTPLEVFFGVAWLVVATWHVAEGDELLGLGFAVLGGANFAAAVLPCVRDFMYRPILRRRR